MHALAAPAAVLVHLDLQQRGLRRAVESRDREAVWIRLLELVGRAVDDELTKLVDARLRAEEPRQRRPVVVALEVEKPVTDLVRIDVRLGRQRHLEGIEEGAFEQAAQLQQRDLAFPARIDVGEAAVAELEADVESEVEVVVDEWIDAVDRLPCRLDLDLGERRAPAA
jgi:hypothetical protein